jgi:beta-glucosidase
MLNFPKDFVWGAAAASYQVEGAAYEDGKGLSVWDMFCRKPGAVWEGQSGEIACDHYHRYQEDVALMQSLGLQAYRFSISWPRMLPQGTGAVNPKGLDFYDRLVDESLRAGITPYITLFHWDLPYELHCRGGWLNPDSSDWFAGYTKVVVEKLSDRVKHWMTFNEPQAFVGLGYQIGKHAPGDKLGLPEILRITHNILLAHGKATQTIRTYSRSASQVGYVLALGLTQVPATDRPEDIEAARLAMFSAIRPEGHECFTNSWWTDPVVFGRYPEDGLQRFAHALPPIGNDDMQTICQPLDFLGLNIYFGRKFQAGPHGIPEMTALAAGYPQTAYHWVVLPETLYWGPKFFWERYHLPIVIAENGLSNIDWVTLDGKVHDPQRIDFLHRYLLQLRKACQNGVDVRGYFHWSLLDNFEWDSGYKERFGLIYVDYPTQKRIPKDSAYWYQQVIASNGAALNAG